MLKHSYSRLLSATCTTILGAALALNGCQSGGGGADGDGGEGGGGGGDAGSKGGSRSGGSGGKGASSQGGTGGSGDAGGEGGESSGGGSGGSANGGAGGNAQGGVGGMSMGGSGGSSMCVSPSVLAGDGDSETRVICEPACVFRPNWPNVHTCGPEGSVYKPVAMKSDGFCGQEYNKDGIFMVPRAKMDTAASNAAASGLIVNSPVPGVARAYLPGGQAGYDAAANGSVALSIWTSGFSGQQATHKIENIHEYLVGRNEIPYTIAIFISGDMGGSARVKQLKDTLIPALKAKWSKLSNDPNYRVIAGQSTAAADSFDTAWLGTDVIAKAIGGSSSVVCFTCMGGQGPCLGDCPEKNSSYVKEVEFCPARPIRWSSTVGTCDIMPTLEARLAAGCSGGTGAGAVDASNCKASWLKANQDLTNALQAKGMPHQLFVFQGGEHTPSDWSNALPWQLRWVFKDITCKQ